MSGLSELGYRSPPHTRLPILKEIFAMEMVLESGMKIVLRDREKLGLIRS